MVKVYFGTNRKPNRKSAPDDFGREFSEDGLANLRFGMAEVTGENLDNYEIFVAPERLPTNENRNTAKDGNPVFGSKNIFERVRGKNDRTRTGHRHFHPWLQCQFQRSANQRRPVETKFLSGCRRSRRECGVVLLAT